MPQRVNSKSDIGNTKRASDVYDVNNCFLTEQGWVYRHFKGDPATTDRYWDEILVAGTAEGEDAIPYSTLSSKGSLLVDSPTYEDGPDDIFDVLYSEHTELKTTTDPLSGDTTQTLVKFGDPANYVMGVNDIPPGPGATGYSQYPPLVDEPGGGGGNPPGGGGDTPTTIGTVTVTGNTAPSANSTQTYSFTISGDAVGYSSSISTDVPNATAIQPNQIQFGDANGGGNVTFTISDADSTDDGAFGTLIVTPEIAGPLGDLDVVDPTNGQAVEGFQSYTFSVSNSGGDAATYLWSVTGDATIIGANNQSSVEVELEYTGNNDVNQNGTAAVTVQATSSDSSETKSLTSDLIVLKPLPVIGSVTVNSVTDPVVATEPSTWNTTVTLGLDSGPTESENTVWTVTPDSGVTIVQDGSNEATITFPDTQGYDVSAELTRTNSRGDSDPVSGTSSITPNPAPTPNTTYTYAVTVVDNGGNKFVLNGEGLTDAETPTLTVAEGDVIVFTQADASNAGHPINVYRNADKSGLDVASLSQIGTPGDGANAQTVYTALDGAGTYYYECENHTGMGGVITVTT